jgi:hypothetical protein
VKSELFVLTHGVEPDVIRRAVPPQCRASVEHRAAADRAAGEWLFEAPAWRLARPGRHFLPSFSWLSRAACQLRFEIAVESAGRWSPWVGSAALGGDDFAPPLPGTPTLSCDIVVFTSTVPAERVRVRARGRSAPGAFETTPWTVALSVSDLAPIAQAAEGSPSRVVLDVPPRSQMVEPEPIRSHICSPTSVAMVLERWGRRVETAEFAAQVFQRALNRYGVWPAAVLAAAHHGVAGYLLRFPDWSSAAWCLAAGLPIVASVRYRQDELPGAAMPKTDGHLVVLTGYDGDDVLVNDPAAPTHADVPRRVRRADLERVWLERSGVGYVFFDPAAAAPTA